MSAVRISRKALHELMAAAELGAGIIDGYRQRAINEARAALAPKKSKPARLATKAAKKAKRASKKEETAAIRAEVLKRSNGYCECGCGTVLGANLDFGEMDHFWGRGKAPQSVQNCWMLARGCHRWKTDNRPSAVAWLKAFLRHCHSHGYATEAYKAAVRLDSIDALAKAAGAGQ